MDASRYDYNRFGCKAQRVGQAVYDILSHDQPDVTVEEILTEYAPKYAAEIEKAVSDGCKRYTLPFYVFVLVKKEMWATNLVRNYFIPRQTAPNGLTMMVSYPNYMKTLYRVNEGGGIQVIWSLPSFDECQTISKNASTHSPELVQWIDDCFSGKMTDDYDKQVSKNFILS